MAAAAGVCDPGLVHIAMTLDAHYLRGSMAAIYSLLKHASCPESLFFHFLAAAPGEGELRRAVAASFPSLWFEIYPFCAEAVAGLISASVRAALEAPLNYPRNHLADLLPRCVPRAIYLDSDVLVADSTPTCSWPTTCGGCGRRGCRPPPWLPRQLLPLLHASLLVRPREKKSLFFSVEFRLVIWGILILLGW